MQQQQSVDNQAKSGPASPIPRLPALSPSISHAHTHTRRPAPGTRHRALKGRASAREASEQTCLFRGTASGLGGAACLLTYFLGGGGGLSFFFYACPPAGEGDPGAGECRSSECRTRADTQTHHAHHTHTQTTQTHRQRGKKAGESTEAEKACTVRDAVSGGGGRHDVASAAGMNAAAVSLAC